MNISEQKVTYQDVINDIVIEHDDYDIAGYALSNHRKKAFLRNPFLNDKNACMLYLQRVDGIVAGRMMFFPSRFSVDGDVKPSLGASSLEVDEKYRSTGIGADLAVYPVFQEGNEVLIYSDFSGEGLDACRALKFKIFTIPKYYYVVHSFSLLTHIGLRGLLFSKICSAIDGGIFLCRKIFDLFEDTLTKFKVEKVKTVPTWIDDIVINDGHKYMEMHDHNWFQWNLDNLFHNEEENINEFFVVKEGERCIGFFMTKTRTQNVNGKGGVKRLTGAIMEWGTVNEEILSEYQIYRLALRTFGKAVDYIVMTIENKKIQKKIKRRLAFKKGEHSIAFKDIKKQYRDADRQELWRLRYGYADSVMN